MKRFKKHTFAICAYGESPYLEECIRSVLNQKYPSKVLVATSTPNDLIRGLCDKYKLPLYVNEGESGITQDWNFAISCCDTPIVTVTHQDDVYAYDYTMRLIKYMRKSKRPLIYFCDYAEIRNGEKVYTNKIMQIKRLMLLPMRLPGTKGLVWLRRRVLSLGDPIVCPSVALFVDNLPNPIFNNHFKTNEDWEAWEKISKFTGDFLYDPTIHVAHRIHEDSATSAAIGDTGRSAEDLEMFSKFWPEPVAKVLTRFYGKSEESNQL